MLFRAVLSGQGVRGGVDSHCAEPHGRKLIFETRIIGK